MKLTAENVEVVFKDCLHNDSENMDDTVLVEGIVHNFGFHSDRLNKHKDDITSMLNYLPKEFKKDGGGWSFLNACDDKNGNQWTGLHIVMEQLITLGIAIKKVEYRLPKSMWSALPGGMPYFVIN